jgi:hypothetical protein
LALTTLLGCREPRTAPVAKALPSPATQLALAQLPAATRTILSLDIEHLRTLPAWKILRATLARDPSHWFEEFMAGSGFDPTSQLHRILLALPGEATPDNRYALVADVERVDRPRLTAWLRGRLPGTGCFVRQRAQVDNQLDSQRDNQLILSHGAWTPLMAPLANSPTLATSALEDPEMRRLCAYVEHGSDHDGPHNVQDAQDGHAVWLAAILPANARRSLRQDPRFPDAASIMRISAFASFEAGLHVEVIADLASSDDAVHLTKRLTVYLNQAKRHPQVLLLGLAPYLEAVHLETRRSRLHASLALQLGQLADFIERIVGLFHLLR